MGWELVQLDRLVGPAFKRDWGRKTGWKKLRCPGGLAPASLLPAQPSKRALTSDDLAPKQRG